MRTGIISKLGVERIGFLIRVARGISTLFKWKDLGTSEVNVGSEFFVLEFYRNFEISNLLIQLLSNSHSFTYSISLSILIYSFNHSCATQLLSY